MQLEQVTVTARKRAENSVDVPISISALSAKDLADRGLSNLQNISAFIPGLDLGRTNTGSAARIYIRGVGQRDPRNFVDPAIGVYVDGVYLARADGALLDLVDIETVEVLRGPQGVLFGKNTVGGAIRLNSRAPGNDFEAQVQFRLGNLDRADALFRVAGAIAKNLRASAAMSSVLRDGYLLNDNNGLDFNNERRQGLRGQLVWQPNDDLSVRSIVDVGRQRERGAGAHCVLAAPMSGTLGASPVGSALNIDSSCRAANSATLGFGNTLTNRGMYELDSRALTVLARRSFADWDLASISSIRHQRLAIESDQDGSAADAITLATHRPDRRTQWSQEFTATGEIGASALSWTAGTYLFDESNQGEQLDAIIGPSGIVQLPASGGSSVYVIGTSRDATETGVRSYAAYAHLDWRASEHWRLNSGLRFTWERRQLSASKATLDPDLVTANNGLIGVMQNRPLTPNGGLVVLPEDAALDVESVQFGARRAACGSGNVTCEGQKIWRRVTPSLTLSSTHLSQHPGLDHGLLYLSLSQGFKSGAINLLSNRLSIAEPESLNNFELGVKLVGRSERLTANAALFLADYKSIQVPIAVPPVAGSNSLPAGIADTGLVNAAKASISGAELEARYISPVGLIANLAIAYLDAEYDEFNDQFGAGDRSEESFSGIPQWTFQLGVQWVLPHPRWGVFTPRLDYSWQDETSHHFGFSSFLCQCFVQPAFSKLNVRTHWLVPGSRIELTAYVNNLTDERTIYGASPLVDIIGGGPVFPDEPRTYGLEFKVRW